MPAPTPMLEVVTWCDDCQKDTETRDGPLWRAICNECGTDREPE